MDFTFDPEAAEKKRRALWFHCKAHHGPRGRNAVSAPPWHYKTPSGYRRQNIQPRGVILRKKAEVESAN